MRDSGVMLCVLPDVCVEVSRDVVLLQISASGCSVVCAQCVVVMSNDSCSAAESVAIEMRNVTAMSAMPLRCVIVLQTCRLLFRGATQVPSRQS